MNALASLRDAPTRPSQGGAECRVWERHPCDLQTSCQPIAARADGDYLWPATVRDISAGGVGLVVARRFEPGAGLVIEIPATDTTPADSLLARVMHATALPHGLWLLGCSFPSQLSDDELRGLLRLARSLQQPAAPGTNAVDRVTAHVPPAASAAGRPRPDPGREYLIPGVTLETTAARGVVLRLRVRAFRLTGAWPLPPGTALQVWLGPKGLQRTGTKLIVSSCSQDERDWTIRYTFADAPSADVLRAFGHPQP
jgi:hypothetical protein